MHPEFEEMERIARYFSWLNRTVARYRRARIEEHRAQPVGRDLVVPSDWPSCNSRVLAFMLASSASCSDSWGDTL